MSKIGQDNESAAQRRKLNRENKKSSAKGNKPVASVKGGGSEEPQMRSVNEPPRIENPLIPQVDNTIQRVDGQRQLVNSDVLAQQMGATPQAPAVVQNTPELKNTAVPDYALSKQQESAQDTFGFEKYEYTPYDRLKGAEEAKKDLSFQAMLQLVRDQTKAQEEKVEKQSKYAKATAWSSLFHALGQLAGLGKNVYIKPESRYLQSALAKADEARALYDKMKADNDMYLIKAENAYIDKLEAQHNAKEKMKADAIKDYNDNLRKAQKDAGDAALGKAKLNLEKQKAEIDAAYKAGTISLKEKELKIKQAEKDAKDADRKAKAYGKMQKDAYISFVDYADKNKEYYLSESRALDIANIMIDRKLATEQDLGLIESQIMGGLEIKDKTKLKARILNFLKNKANHTEDVRNVLDYVSMDNQSSLKNYQDEQDSEDNDISGFTF